MGQGYKSFKNHLLEEPPSQLGAAHTCLSLSLGRGSWGLSSGHNAVFALMKLQVVHEDNCYYMNVLGTASVFTDSNCQLPTPTQLNAPHQNRRQENQKGGRSLSQMGEGSLGRRQEASNKALLPLTQVLGCHLAQPFPGIERSQFIGPLCAPSHVIPGQS